MNLWWTGRTRFDFAEGQKFFSLFINFNYPFVRPLASELTLTKRDDTD